MAIIGTVVAINGAGAAGGTASVLSEDGKQIILKLNDTIQPGDTIITPKGVVVELQLINGKKVLVSAEQTVKITQELADVIPPSADDSSIDLATVQAVIQAIKEGKDINEVLEETAAGLNGGSGATNYGFGFVNLLRIIQDLRGFAFDQDNALVLERQIEAFRDGDDNARLDTQTTDNIRPVGTPSSASVAEDGGAISVVLGGADSDGIVFAYVITSSPSAAQGSLVYDNDGNPSTPPVAVPLNTVLTAAQAASIQFLPAPNFNGTINIPFVVIDDKGAVSDPVNAVITVTPVNDAPVDGDEANTVTQNVTLTVADGAAGDLLNNATDVDGNPLSITSFLVAGNATPITVTPSTAGVANIAGVGILTINANGSYSFAPAANYVGAIPVVTYTVADGVGGTDTSTLTLSITPVNDAPIAVTDNYTMAEDGAAITLTPLTGDSDPDGTTPTIQSINGTTLTPGVAQNIAVTGGTVNISTTGVITFTPTANFNGTVTFPYVITDGTSTATANQVITVTPVNDAPVDGDEANTVTQNVTLTVADGAAGDLLNNATDVDGNPLSITSFLVAGNATPITVTPSTAGVANIAGVGILTINANGSYSFAPAANYVGAIPVVTYTVADGVGGTDTSTLTLTIGANNPPVDGNESNTVTEDTTLTVADGAAGDLLNNATDVDGNPLSITSFLVAGNATPITVTPSTAGVANIAGVGILTINANGSYSFAPAANYVGAIPVVTYTVADGVGGTDTSTLTLSITPVNDAPIAVTDNYTMAEDGAAITLTPLTGDSDPDGTTPTIQSINGTTLTPGVAQNIAVTGGTVNISTTGVITFTPTANFNGTVTFPYVITDGTSTATANQVITVTPVNDAPVDGDEANTVTQNVTLTVADGAAGDLLNNATDVDGNPLSITSFLVAGNATPITVTPSTAGVANIAGVGILTINANGSYSFAPAANYVGAIPVVTYTVADGVGGTDTSTLTLTIGANNPPVDGNESNTVTEDTTLTVADGAAGDLLNNATDVDGNPLSITSFLVAGNATPITVTPSTAGVANIAGVGILTINANGSYSFAPAANYVGAIPVVTYTVADGVGGTDTSTLTLSITPVNDAPIAVTDNYTMAEDGAAITLTPLTGDSDPDGTTPTIQSINGTTLTPGVAQNIAVTGGTVNISTTGVITFTPTANFNGTVTFPYVITDGTSTATANQVITVTPVNDAPVDGDEANTVTQNVTLTVADGAAGDLLNNATDVDGNPLSITSFLVAGNATPITVTPSTAGVANIAGVGILTINANGSYSFAPAANYVGAIPVVTYTVADGVGGTDTSTLTLTIGANNPPVDGNESNTVTEDTTLTVADGAAGDLLNNATDVDGNPLSITSFLVAGNATPITVTPSTAGVANIAGVGILTINANGSYSFAPAANYVGAIPVVTYTVADGVGGTDTSTLTLSITPVNDAPIAVTDNYTMAEDGAAITLTPLTGDSDPDGTTPTIQSINGTTLTPGVAQNIAVTGGTVNISTTGVITFTPTANFNGTVTFPYVITDGTSTATANQVITVTPVNDAPVDGDEANTVTQNVTLTVADGAAGDLLNNATDVDGNPLSITSFLVAGNATPITVTPSTAGVANIAGVGILTINANGSYSFAPAANYVGAIPVVTYTVADGVGGTDTSTLTLTIGANNPPVDGNESNTVTEDTTLTVADGAAGDLLNNATDVDGNPLSITSFLVAGNATPITVTPSTAGVANIAGVGILTINANGSYSFAPAANYVGAIPVVTYTVADGVGGTDTSTLTLSITPVNDAPIAVTDNYTMAEDGAAITLTPLTGDSDPDGTTPTIQSINGTTLTPGVAQNIAVTGGTVNISTTGVITFTPTANFNGTVTFPYVITDGTSTATANQVITVTPVNDAPVDGDEANTVTQNVTLTVADGAAGDLLNNATDVDGNPLSITSFLVAGNATPITVTPSTAGVANIAGVGILTINANGSYSFAPAANYVGAIPVVTYTVADGVGGTDTSTLTLTIGANNPPVDGNESNTVTEDTTLTVADGAAGDLLNNATDVDGNPLSITSFLVAGNATPITVTPSTAGVANIAGVGILTINANGSYSFAPAANYVGAIPVVTYTVADGVGGTDTSTLTLSITPVNDAPIAVTDNYTMAEDGAAITLTPLTGDSDPDGTTPTIQSINGTTLTPGVAQNIAVTGGTVNISTTGVITFTPTANFNGTVTFPYVITDGTSTATANQVITVTPVNDAPVDGDEANTVTQNVTLTVADGAAGDLLNNATDVDGNPLSITSFLVAGNATPITVTPSTAGVANIAGVGILTINANGSYSFAPAANYVGAIPVVTYTVADGVGGTDTSTLTLTIGANNPPVDGNESNTVTEDTTLTVADGAAGDLLNNATDVDGNPLSITSFLVAGNATPITVTPSTAGVANIAGVGILTINANGSYSFAPAANYVGAIPVVTYTVADGVGGTDTSTLTLSITPVNDAPIAVTDNYTMAEDGAAITLTPLTGDSDPDGTTPTIQSINGTTLTPGVAQNIAVTGGTVNISTTGVITFTPTANFNGTVTFPYVITDGTSTATANQVITVTPVNDAPVDGDEANTVTQNVTLTVADGAAGDLLNNATDVDGNPLSITSFLVAGNATPITVTPSTAGVANIAGVGILTINANGSYSFAPAANYVGAIPVVTYTVADGVGGTDTSTLTLTIGANNPPVDGNESNTVTEDTTLTVADGAAGDLLNNATDVDGNPLSITSFLVAGNATPITVTPSTAGVANIAGVGILTINANGSYSFAPAANYVGAIPVVTYTVADGVGGTDTSTLTLSITPVNDAPIAVTDNYTMAEDGAAITLTPLTGDSDPDGTTPTIQSINGTTLTPGVAQNIAVTGGTVNISTTGVITFTPTANFNGTVTFPYVITDGTSTATANQVITVTPVNDAPVDGDEANTVTQNVTLTVADGAAGDLLNNATDVDGNPLSITSFLVAGNATPITVTPSTAGVANIAGVGILTINANGSYSFAPAANYVGAIPVVTYTVADGVGGTDTSTLTLTIGANNPPVDGNESNTVTEDTTLTVADGAAGDLLNNATDVDGNPLSITSFLVAGNATPITVTPSTAGVANIAGVGILTINANGSYSFAPAANYVGAIPVVTYTVADGVGGTDTSTLTLSITPVNDAPIAVTDNYTMAEDGAAITLTPLTGDSDPDGTTPTIQSINGTTLTPGVAQNIAVTGGTVNISTTGVITFTPTANFNGTVTFPYVITDGTSTATANQVITVTPVNDAPILDLDGSVVGTQYDVSYTENGVPVSIANTNMTITDVDDTNIESATIRLSTPLAEDVLSAVGFPIGGITASAYNPTTGIITLTGTGTLAQYQAAIRAITYSNTSDNPNSAERTILVTVNDGDLNSNQAITTITVLAVNDKPVLDLDTTVAGTGFTNTFTENGTTVSIARTNSVSVTDSDDTNIESSTIRITNFQAGDVLSVTGLPFGIVAGPYNPATGTLTLTGSATLAQYQTAIGLIRFSNTSDAPNTVARSITVVVNDGNVDSDIATSTVNVIAVNDTPTIAPLASIGVTEDVATKLTGLSFNDIDAGTNNVTVTLTVPAGTLSATSGSGVVVGGTATALTLTGTLAAINAFVSSGTGVFYTTALNANGSVNLTVNINDNGNTGIDPGLTGTATNEQASLVVSINITAVNDAPVGVADNYASVEGTTTVKTSVLVNDTDPEGNAISVAQIAVNALGTGTQTANGSNTITTALGGTVVMNVDGTYTYTAPQRNHADAVSDVDSFAYKTQDSLGVVSSTWTTVTINVTDSAPVANADVDSVGFNTTVNGNVITGAGGITADTLNVDAPITLTSAAGALTGVTLTQGSLVSSVAITNALPANAALLAAHGGIGTQYTTTNGILKVFVDGYYEYTAQGVSRTVTNPTAVTSFTSASVNVYGFTGTTLWQGGATTGNLVIAQLNATQAALVNFSNNGTTAVETDDGLGVTGTTGIDNGDKLVIALNGSTKSVSLTINNLASTETLSYDIYNAAGQRLNTVTGSFSGTGAATLVNTLTITNGTAFSYIVIRSPNAATSFRLDGINTTLEPSATPDRFVYTITDNDGSISASTLTLNYDSNITAANDVTKVFESGINQNGTQTAGTQELQTTETVSGNLLANDTGVSALTTIAVSNGTFAGGTSVASAADANGVVTVNITDTTGSRAVATVTVYTQDFGSFVKGDYVVNLVGKTTQGVNDSFTVNYTLNTTGAPASNATLTVNVVDDVPIAENTITEVAATQLPVFNLFFMIDVSGSMTFSGASGDQRLVDADGNATITASTNAFGNNTTMTGGVRFDSTTLGSSTLSQTYQAVAALISKYFDESTNVSVKLGVFSSGARYDNVAYTTKASALAALAALTAVGGGTNYSAGLTALQGMIGTVADPDDGVSRISYFVTDGVPSSSSTTGTVYSTATGTTGTTVTSDASDPATSTGYLNYINTNNVTSYAVAVGPAVPSTTALANVHNVDSNASDVETGTVNNGKDLPIVVSDLSKLTETLLSTVAESFGGNIAGNGSGVIFGADGGYVLFIDLLLDGPDADTTPDTIVRFTYNPTTGEITNNNNAIAGGTVTGSTLNLSSAQGFTKGSLIFNFATGDYTYFPQGNSVAGDQVDIAFTIVDGDGDTASAVNSIRFVDGKPQAFNDFDTLTPSTAAANTKFFEGNVLNADGTDGGGTQISGFKTGASGEDDTADDADVTSIVFKGQTFDLTTASSGTLAGGNYTINASGELTWTNSTNSANVLIFHRDGYYKYTPPATQTADLPEDAAVTVSFANSATAATANGITLGAYTRTGNTSDAADGAVSFNATGAGVTGGDASNRVDNLENFSISFSSVTHPQGVQDVSVNITNSLLGNNGNGSIGAVQFSIYDIAGNLLGQFVYSTAGTSATVTIPTIYSNIGRILIQPNSTNVATSGSVAGSIQVAGVTFNSINVATTAVIPDEVIQYTITDKDTTTAADSSTANLTLHVVTNEYIGRTGSENVTGSAGNDLITQTADAGTLNGLAGNDIIRGGEGGDTIDGGADDDQLYGGDGNDTIIGGTGNDYLYGEDGIDNLQGGDGNDIITGGAGADIILGGTGNDTITGGAGNDTLTGGNGADTFVWQLADRGAKGTPALDTITDFDVAPVTLVSGLPTGGDRLDLRDLLSGENHDVGTGNLSDYLHFEKVGADTIIHVSTSGEFASGFNSSKDVQKITLTNADLVQTFTDDQAIIQNLLSNNKLITD